MATETERLRDALHNALLHVEAGALIQQAKGSPALLVPILKSRTRLRDDGKTFGLYAVDDEGKPSGDDVAGLLGQLQKSPDYAAAFEGGSGGHRPAGKPAATGRRTLTPEQLAELSPTERLKAIRLVGGK